MFGGGGIESDWGGGGRAAVRAEPAIFFRGGMSSFRVGTPPSPSPKEGLQETLSILWIW